MMKTFIILFFLFVSAPAGAMDLDKYLKETETLTEQGKYQEALERHIWYHNHAQEYDARDWRRLTWALGSWIKLGKKYQPALDALHDINVEKSNRLEAGQGNRAMFEEVKQINFAWGAHYRTVELFRKLDQSQPELARACWKLAWFEVSYYKERDLVDKYIPDPNKALDILIAGYENKRTEVKAQQPNQEFFELAMYKAEKPWAWKMRDLIKVYVNLCDKEVALQLQKKAMAALDHPEIMGATSRLPYCQ